MGRPLELQDSHLGTAKRVMEQWRWDLEPGFGVGH